MAPTQKTEWNFCKASTLSKIYELCEQKKVKDLKNIFKKSHRKKSGEKKTFIQVQETQRTSNRKDHERNPHRIVKTLNILNTQRALEASRKKSQVTYQGKPITITAEFLLNFKGQKSLKQSGHQVLKDHRC